MGRIDAKIKGKTPKILNESLHMNNLYNLQHPGRSGKVSHVIDMSQDSYIFCFEGWRGGGKTTAMTMFAIMLNWQLDMRLITNFPIEYILQKRDKSKHLVKAESMDFQKILTFDAEYKNSLILLDEAPDVIGNMRAMSNKSMLINIFVREIRKNKNSLFLGAQQFELIDKSLRWQTDVIVLCTDASRKFGNRGMRRGACILLDFFDNSGMWTGHPYYTLGYGDARIPGKNSALQLVFKPMVMWDDKEHNAVFDTYYQQDIMESLRKAVLKVDNYEIASVRDAPGSLQYLTTAATLINSVKASEGQAIYQKDFFKSMGALTNKDKLALSKRLTASDIKKGQDNTGHYYDFSSFDFDTFLGNNGKNEGN